MNTASRKKWNNYAGCFNCYSGYRQHRTGFKKCDGNEMAYYVYTASWSKFQSHENIVVIK